ncbi:MAG: tetratricopeptide repeat protein [Candidatus Sulfotelmatobacter sp.]
MPEELIALGYQARREGRREDARKFFCESVELCRGGDDQSLLARALSGLAQIERDFGNRGAAIECYREAVDILRSGADPLSFAHTIRHLGDVLRGDGSLEEAAPCYEEALRIYCNSGETSALDLANTLRGFALLRGAVGEAEEAMSLWRDARGLYESVNVEAGVRESDEQIARLMAK